MTHGNLPHWSQFGKMHFVTFRLADSLPHEKLKQIKNEREQWLARYGQPSTESQWHEYHLLFSDRINQWLDSNHGQCLLARPECSQIVADAMGHFNQKWYRLDYWVVMPNHVHVLLIPFHPNTLKDILHSWKSYTSKEVNKITHRTGQLWQHESFDHIVRNTRQLEKFRAYMIEN